MAVVASPLSSIGGLSRCCCPGLPLLLALRTSSRQHVSLCCRSRLPTPHILQARLQPPRTWPSTYSRSGSRRPYSAGPPPERPDEPTTPSKADNTNPNTSATPPNPPSPAPHNPGSPSNPENTSPEPPPDGRRPDPGPQHQSSDPAVPDQSSTATSREDELPSQSESRRARISATFQTFMDNAQRAATEASNWASNATGTSYRAIDGLKRQNAELESGLARSREALDRARRGYQAVVQRRLQTQREVNTLLARKDGWTPHDLERFTSLYRDDHTLDAAVATAAGELAAAERETERLRERLVAGILGRYHEEQIWSDRIRRLSTWGTWGLMGVNVLLFLLFQFGAEPWRRARLTRGFEEKVAEGVRRVLEEERARVGAGTGAEVAVGAPSDAAASASLPVAVQDVAEAEQADAAAPVLAEPDKEASPSPSPSIPVPAGESTAPAKLPLLATVWMMMTRDFLVVPGRWKDALRDLASDRVVWLRMRDVSLMVAEGAVTGAAIAAAMAAWLMRR